jgi:hypothetical protein
VVCWQDALHVGKVLATCYCIPVLADPEIKYILLDAPYFQSQSWFHKLLTVTVTITKILEIQKSPAFHPWYLDSYVNLFAGSVMVTVTVIKTRVTKKFTPFPHCVLAIMPTCSELPYMKCCLSPVIIVFITLCAIPDDNA